MSNILKTYIGGFQTLFRKKCKIFESFKNFKVNFKSDKNGLNWCHWIIGCDCHVREIGKNVFDFAHGKSPSISNDFQKVTILSFSSYNFTCLFSDLSHKNVSFIGKSCFKICIFQKLETIKSFIIESYIFYTEYLYFQMYLFLWFLIF